MDMETFFTVLYVLINDWYVSDIQASKSRVGHPGKLTDSEVLTLAIASQWRAGVPWTSERSFVRYMNARGRELFPNMIQRSAFNRRVRYLTGVIVRLQQLLADLLEDEKDIFECVDSLELPAFSNGQQQRQKSHWLYESTHGRGAHGNWFWGDFLLTSVTRSGIITGWIIGTAAINDHWLMEGLLSARAGSPGLREPERRRRGGWQRASPPPVGYMGGWLAAGTDKQRPYLSDKGFGGQRWSDHWSRRYTANVITVPQDHAITQAKWSRAWKLWHAHHRQIVETTFSVLTQVFDIKHLNAHSRWGQLTRIVCKMVGYNIGIYLNRLLGRNDLQHATLLCW